MDREEILDRYEAPLRRGTLAVPPARSARGTNPRCGDVVTMYASVRDGAVERVRFDGGGCTISQAAADIAAELAEGRALESVQRLQLSDVLERLGETTRPDCASLGLHTLQQALAAADDIVRAHVRIAGRVQGVGFRYTTADEAERRRLTGWVRNLGEGSVEAVFQGARNAVEDMVRWCHRGPPGAYVRDVKVDWDEPLDHFAGFDIGRTVER
ncbi:MAG TPA: acylphosphatase [Chloroflexota bacterium]|nr:acylphosphatase [Chloroflexota bacterium]